MMLRRHYTNVATSNDQNAFLNRCPVHGTPHWFDRSQQRVLFSYFWTHKGYTSYSLCPSLQQCKRFSSHSSMGFVSYPNARVISHCVWSLSVSGSRLSSCSCSALVSISSLIFYRDIAQALIAKNTANRNETMQSRPPICHIYQQSIFSRTFTHSLTYVLENIHARNYALYLRYKQFSTWWTNVTNDRIQQQWRGRA